KRRIVGMSQRGLFEEPDAGASSADEDGGLFRVVPRFPALGQISNGDLFSLRLTNNTATLTHGLHRFAAKYIPQIPAWVLEEFAHGDTAVLVPFWGPGTTLAEALPRGGKSIGIDCAPLACLIAGAKTANVRPAMIHELGQSLRAGWHGPSDRLEFPMPGLAN